MPEFLYAVERSKKPADQIEGIVCESLTVSGYTYSDNLDAAFAAAEEWCAVPGTYSIAVRRTGAVKHSRRTFVKKLP